MGKVAESLSPTFDIGRQLLARQGFSRSDVGFADKDKGGNEKTNPCAWNMDVHRLAEHDIHRRHCMHCQ